MPIEIIKYTCQYKCGKKAVSKKETMLKHESTCWYNPDLKTCKTCKNERYLFDSNEILPNGTHYPGEGWIRECRNEKGKEILEQWYDKRDAELEQEYQDKLKLYTEPDIKPEDDFFLSLRKKLSPGPPIREYINDRPIPPIINCPHHELK